MTKYQVPREHYFRMYNKVFDLDLKATTFLVYSYLVCCAGNKGSCWPSLETISRKTGLSISTVQEHLKILEQRQLISKSRHRIDGGRGKNNVYTLLSLDNPDVYRMPSVPEELPLHIGNIPLEKLTTMDLQKLYRKLVNKGRVERIEAKHQPKGLSAKTVRNINQVISSAMDFAVAQKIIPENPCKAVALPKVEHKEMKTIPMEQLQAFLQEVKATGVYEMYYIELATGLRRGELLGLKWTDIDWKNGIIKIRRQVARVDGQILEAPLKTKNSYRTVTISQQAIEVLKQQKEKTNDEYVFPSPNGGPISPDSVNNMLKRVLARTGIPKVRFHDLRHTFATIALQNGVDIKTVSGMLGHFSAGFTLDTYAHVTTSAQKEAADTIGNVLNV